MPGTVREVSATLVARITRRAEPRSNTRYCIEMADSGGSAGPPQCMFETLAQCIASKTAPSDRCMLNPAFDARARNIR